MAESAGKPQAAKTKAEKAKVEKNKAEKSHTAKAASVKGGSSRQNAGGRADAEAKAGVGAKAGALARPDSAPIDFAAAPGNYVNRELSWLEFNYRVPGLKWTRTTDLTLIRRAL